MTMKNNAVLERLPRHLLDLAVEQPYDEYTPQDHSVWRYVMRRNVSYLRTVAHESYLEGLRKTGITLERIPRIEEMNDALGTLGWGAITVDGFIPPSAFMELQAYNVLPIAADIRSIEQIDYTPAPDIIHEAAGHLPIIADPDYAQYLNYIGRLGSKAFASALNQEVYEAIRHLSIVKADPYSSPEDTREAERILEELQSRTEKPSEMTRIRNLHWWTVEYGLVGDLRRPKIYGAGLLSSIGESAHCLQDSVRKLPYTLAAMEQDFDITKEQPQLFVTPDFHHLNVVLREFERTMALASGGLQSLRKAVESGGVATCVYSSGLQLSGVFTEVVSADNRPLYLKTKGPSALSCRGRQLEGHGRDYHADGFGSPVGRLQGHEKPLELWKDAHLREAGLPAGERVRFQFEGGVTVEGRIGRVQRDSGKIVVISFSDCTVSYGSRVLFSPDWGTYDMGVGAEVVSAFNGPADPDAFGLKLPVPPERTHRIRHSARARELHRLYGEVRRLREGAQGLSRLEEIGDRLVREYPEDWLLPLEIVELAHSRGLKGAWLEKLQASFGDRLLNLDTPK
jgi:phenylalanine-4-hydroxylase